MQHIKNKYRKKILEAIVFFSQKGKIKYPSKMMIFKLLAEMDCRHFEETGFSVTNLDYDAFKKGPVPKILHDEMTKDGKTLLPKDFESSLTIEEIKYKDNNEKEHIYWKFIAKRKPDLDCFSPRQLRIMNEVADIYKDATPTEASKASHEPNKMWTKTVAKKGEGARIEFAEGLTVKDLPPEIVKERLKEQKAFIYNYNI